MKWFSGPFFGICIVFYFTYFILVALSIVANVLTILTVVIDFSIIVDNWDLSNFHILFFASFLFLFRVYEY